MAHWYDFISASAANASKSIETFGKMAQRHVPGIDAITRATNASIDGGIGHIDARRNGDGGQSKAHGTIDRSDMNKPSNSITVHAKYDYQPEKTVRDDIRAEAMILGINPTG